MVASLEKSNVEDIFELSLVQKGMLFHYLNEPHGNAYNVQLSFRITGKFELSTIQRAVNLVQSQNEMLRSVFRWERISKPIQIILKDYPLQIVYRDISAVGNAAEVAQLCVSEEKYKRFDITNLPLRIQLLKIADDSHILTITHHHILYDGWSTGIFLSELFECYAKLSAGEKIVITPKKHPREVFPVLQKRTSSVDAQAFWSAYLSDRTGGSFLTDSHSDASSHKTIERVHAQVPLNRLNKFVKTHKVTTASLVYAAYGILLQKYHNTSDVIFGTTVSGRDGSVDGVERVVGNFINTIPLRLKDIDDMSFRDVVKQVYNDLVSRQEYNSFSYAEIKQLLDLKQTEELFDSLLVVENYPLDKTVLGDHGTFSVELNDVYENIGMPLVFSVFIKKNLQIELTFRTDLFQKEFAQALIDRFVRIISAIISKPDSSIRSFEVLSVREKKHVLEDFNQTTEKISRETVISFFEKQVRRTPSNIALQYPGKTVGYQTLHDHVVRIAAALQKKAGIRKGDIVGVMLERDEYLIPSIFGIMKAGAAYLPIDPRYPAARINAIIADSKLTTIITRPSLVPDEINGTGLEIIDVTDESQFVRSSYKLSNVKVTQDDLAYVIYTSGSTGTPKGVAVGHRSLSNIIQYLQKSYPLCESDSYLLKTTTSFDVSCAELFGWFFEGGSLTVLPPDEEKESHKILDTIQRNRVTHINFVPSMFSVFVDELEHGDVTKIKSLKYIFLAGEALSRELVKRFDLLATEVQLENIYGPTESTIYSCRFPTRDLYDRPKVPIGKPVGNTRLYVIDRVGHLCPIGVPGELCVGGMALAYGYLHNDELTAKKFVTLPFAKWERIYKTGDLVRWLSSGDIEYLGRIDNQVKIRGNRVELGEIENRLCEHDQIKESITIIREKDGSKFLVSYYVSDFALEDEDLRRFLSERLPDYMVPNYYVHLKSLPVTTNGKLDAKALPDPGMRLENFITPRTEVEKLLVEIWSSVLGTKISINDNFFSVGGDSIKSIQISSKMRNAGYEMTVRDTFRNPTIKDLAAELKKTTSIPDQSHIDGEIPLTPIQHWFFSGAIKNKNHFNQSVIMNFTDRLSRATVQRVFEKLQQHHDVLRVVFENMNGVVVQKNPGTIVPVAIDEHDLTLIEDVDEQIGRLADERQASIDLGRGPLMKLGLYHTISGSRLLVVIHHLIVDGVSWRILFEDIATLLQQISSGSALTLPLKTNSYQAWSNQLWKYANTKTFEKNEKFWNAFSKVSTNNIPRDFPEGNAELKYLQTISFRLDQNATQKLLTEVHRPFNTKMNEILLAGLLMAIWKRYAIEGIAIDVESHGREQIDQSIDTTRTVGWFTSIYPVHLFHEGRSLPEIIKTVKESLRRIPANGIDYLIGKYKTQTRGSLDHGASSAGILFNYLGQFDNNINGNSYNLTHTGKGAEVSPEETWNYDWDILAVVANDELEITLRYSSNQFLQSSAESLMTAYRACLQQITEYCLKCKSVEITPSDLSYKDLTAEQLHALVQRYDIEDIYPLSPMQEAMLLHSITEPDSIHYFEQKTITIEGKIDRSVVERTLNVLVARYPILRTIFLHESYQQPLQLVVKERIQALVYRDVTEECSRTSKIVVVKSYQEKDQAEKFNLSKDALLRVALLETVRNSEFVFIWSYPHILMDGWCMNTILREFKLIYSRIVAGSDVNLPVVAPYANYISWLLQKDKEISLDYWRQYLSGYESIAALPKRESLPSTISYDAASFQLSLETQTTLSLYKFSREFGVTVTTMLQVAWGIVLSKYNHTRDVIFGSVVSGRPTEIGGVETMVGLFINTIPVRIAYSNADSILSVLQQVQQSAVESTIHHYHSLAEIQRISRLGKELLSHLMIVENYPIEKDLLKENSRDDFRITNIEVLDQANYDFSIVVHPGECLNIKFLYNSNVYDKGLVERVAGHFSGMLDQLIKDPNGKISDVDIVGVHERDSLFMSLDNISVPYPLFETIVSLFERQATRTPTNTAVKLGTDSITYRELKERSDKLAFILHENGVYSQQIVGLLMDRSIDTVVGMLGILKAGGAYLPIDVDYPKHRISYMINDSKSTIVVTNGWAGKLLPGDLTIIDINEITKLGNVDVVHDIKPSDLCYVIYTSGTTGNPKGVMVEHRNVVRLFFNDKALFDFNDKDIWTMFHSPSFDFSVWEIYGALFFGGKVIVVPKLLAKDPQAFVAMVSQEKVTILNQTPSAFFNFIDEALRRELSLSLRQIIFGGEALTPRRLKEWRAKYPWVSLINMFGITETTVHVTYKEITEFEIDHNISNLGKPIPTLAIYVFDQDRHVVPKGVVGELYVGGAGVSRGYLGKPELTAQKFVRNPYKENDTLYRSGDLARILSNGDLEYVGRIDHQIQLRGFRIELDEIESQLNEHEGIRKSVVVAKDKGGDKYLVAYYVSDGPIRSAELRQFLSEKLADYMLPAMYVHINEFPLTSNGKLDRSALPDPVVTGVTDRIAPRTTEEKLLADVWSAVLNTENVGVTDDFFSIGGDSIKSIQVSARVRNAGYDVSVKDILTYQTIEALSGKLKPIRSIPDQSLVQGYVPLTPIQKWFFEGFIQRKHHYNQSVLLHCQESLSIDVVRKIFAKLYEHHDALRMVFKITPDQVIQENKIVDLELRVDEFDLRNNREQAFDLSEAANAIQSNIDLANGPLIKVGLFRMTDGCRLLIVIHHLVVDGLSWRILIEDIQTLYQQVQSGSPLKLPNKSSSFQVWSRYLQDYMQTDAFEKSKLFWANVDKNEKWQIPTDTSTTKKARSSSFRLSQTQTTRILTIAHAAFGTQINDLLLTAMLLALRHQYQQNIITVDVETHGRHLTSGDLDLGKTIGWFTSIYPLTLETSTDDFAAAIKNVKESIRQIPNNGFDYLLYKYGDPSTNDIAREKRSILFNYLGQFDSDLKGTLFSIAGEDRGDEMSPDEVSPYYWDISSIITGGELKMSLRYNNEFFSDEIIDMFMSVYSDTLNSVTNYCCGVMSRSLTPSDLTYRKLSIGQVDHLQSKYELQDVYPLSPIQEGIFYHYLLDEAADHYFQQMTCRVVGRLDIEAVEQAVNGLIERFDVLRTIVVNDAEYERPLQLILRERKISVRFEDMRSFAVADRQHRIEKYQDEDRALKFDLSKDVMMRLTVLQEQDDRFIFILSHHHILMDGWCMPILVRTFRELYRAAKTGNRVILPAVQKYSRYIEWLEQKDKSESASYWREYIRDYETRAEFPKKATPVTQAASYDCRKWIIDKQQASSIRDFCKRQGITLNTFFQTAWAILLSKYNNVSDVVFGSVVSGRSSQVEGIEDMVGIFINTIPVRFRHDDSQTIADSLHYMQAESIRAERYHQHPLSEIQSYSRLGADLIKHIIVFENYPVSLPGTGADNDFGITDLEFFQRSNYDLSLSVIPEQDIEVRIDFNCNIFDKEVAGMALVRLRTIMDLAVKNCNTLVSDVEIITAKEKSVLLEGFNNTKVDYHNQSTIIELFERCVSRYPERSAAVFKDQMLTYEELSGKANALAEMMRAKNVLPGDRVIVMIDHSFELLISLVATMKCGCTFVPVDVDWPMERRDFVLRSTGASLVLCVDSALLEGLKPTSFLLVRTEDLSVISQCETGPHDLDSSIYVIYTSGSTGTPQGVEIPYRGIMNRLLWMNDFFGVDTSRSVLQMTRYVFDSAVWELFWPLINGGKTIIWPSEWIMTSEKVCSLVERHQIKIADLTPSLFNMIFEQIENSSTETRRQLATLKYIIQGGEEMNEKITRQFLHEYPSVKVVNLYGPTEASIGCVFHEVNKSGVGKVPVGKPIANTKILVLDRNNNALPIDISGELCISGECLGKGYFRNDEQTASKFLTIEKYGTRVYKTGDVARWLPDGNIEFLGRIDNQVKIHGHRIETSEIEFHLLQYRDIREAVVLLNNTSDDKYLVAFYTSDAPIPSELLKNFLSSKLPSYMVPMEYVRQAAFEVTSGRKIDRKAIKFPGVRTNDVYNPPVGAMENSLAEIWSSVLKLEKSTISSAKSFFDLGGHSLKATSLVNKIRKHFDVHIPLKELFGAPTIQQLAALIKASMKTEYQPIRKISDKDHYRLSSAQRRLYFLSQFDSQSVAYNMPHVLKVAGILDRERLSGAFGKLLLRHDILRTFITIIDGEPFQKVHSEVDFSVGHVKLANGDATALLKKLIRPFDLMNNILIRVYVIEQSALDFILLVDMHHIITDGVSQSVIIKDLMALYNYEDLPPLQLQYRDYAEWQQDFSATTDSARAKKFWIDSFRGDIPKLQLPTDHERPMLKKHEGARYSFQIDKEASNQLKALAEKERATTFMVLLTIFKILLSKTSNQRDIIVGTPTSGRSHAEVEEMVGMFVNTLALRTRITGNPTFSGLLSQVRSSTLTSFEHQDYPYDSLIEELNSPREISRNPLFDTLFSFENFDDVDLRIPGLVISPLDIGFYNTKFDLSLFAKETPDGLALTFEYWTALFDRNTIETFGGYFRQILSAVISDANIVISDIDMFGVKEKEKLIFGFNNTSVELSKTETIMSLFERSVKQFPNELAIEHDGDCVTYSMLSTDVDQMARYLQNVLGVKKGDLVGLVLPRSKHLVSMILAILKAGATYLPIDPDYPEKRIGAIVKDSRLKLLITEDNIPGPKDFLEETQQLSNVDVSGTDLAYVIYTSGSTGAPKGVMIEHKSLLNYIKWCVHYYANNEVCSFPLYTSISFDLTVTSIFTPLSTGGKIKIYNGDPGVTIRKIAMDDDLDVIKLTPSHLKIIREDDQLENRSQKTKKLIVGGEELETKLARDIHNKFNGNIVIYNEYGPTEATVGCMIYQFIPGETSSAVPIGVPVNNTQIYILDEYLNPVPAGTMGELFISGEGVARGYLGSDELTRSKFIDNPFVAATKAYRTGDLAMRRKDGNILFKGRIDEQVKINGFRIEFAEIESQLSMYDGIDHAAVSVKGTTDVKYLVGYYVSSRYLDPDVLRRFMADRLPDHMVPNYYMRLEKLPLTVNGKLNRSLLPDVDIEMETYVPPSNHIEESLVSIWSEVLNIKIEKIGRRSNFFELGGHSLSATLLVNKIYSALDIEIPLKEVFIKKNIENLADYIITVKQMRPDVGNDRELTELTI